MIVILNNGTKIKVKKEFAQSVMQGIIKTPGGPKQWQCFLDTDNNAISGFNLQEVAAICDEEDIVTDPTGRLEKLGAIVDKGLL